MKKFNGFRIPENLPENGFLVSWLRKKKPIELTNLDQGDPLDSRAGEAIPKDKNLSRIEIFNGLIAEYRSATRKSVQAGLDNNWPEWEAQLKEKDRLAQGVRELGWEPAFHISDREYQKRIVELIRRHPPRSLDSLTRLFHTGKADWAHGGLCFSMPVGFQYSWEEFTAEQNVVACKRQDRRQWGECNGTSRKVSALIEAALSVFTGRPPALAWWLIQKLPDDSRGHSFVALHPTGKEPIALDPLPYGFNLKSSAVYLKHDPFRISMAAYYYNQALRQDMGSKYLEKERLYQKAVELNPRYDMAWNNLGWVSKKLGKLREAESFLKRALVLNPKNNFARENLLNLQKQK